MKTDIVCLDSCILSDIFRTMSQHHKDSFTLLEQLTKQGVQLVVSDLVCAELMGTFRNQDKIMAAFAQIGVVINVHTIEDAFRAGGMRADLADKKHDMRGRKHLIDFMIAAQAMRLGALATRDADFEPVEKTYKLKIYWA